MAESVVLYDFSVVYAPADEAWANRLATALRERRQSLPDGLDQIDPSTARNLVALWSAHARTAPNVSAAIHRFNESRLASPGARRLIFVLLSLDRPDYEEVEVIDDLANTTAGPESVSNELWTDVVNVIVQPEPLKPRNRGRNRRPGGTPTQSAAQTSSDDPLRIENVGQRYRLFPSTHDIITHAPELSGKSINNITTALLLAAICNRGTVTPTPTWAPAWLRSRWGDDGNRRLIDLAKLNAERGQADDRPPVPVLTAGSDAILASAQQIAQRTSSSDEIRVRHLLGALLKDPRGPSESTALSAISELGHDIVKLRESFFDFVREADDDDDAWGEILLGAKEDSRILPGFDADSDTGDDQLDIKPDVMAFAGLIAARTLKPPLSIGLFGEWGSGKTFFMRMLARQVASLAQHGRDEWYRNRTRQREQPYYRRIVQIEFNAWHYADGNLWASLVQHIFDNLRIDDKRRASQDLQEPILQKLNVEKAAEAQARREHEAAKSQRDAAVQAVSDAKKEFEIKAEELAQMSGKNVLADAPTEDVANAFAPLLAELGINAAITKGVELRATLAEAKTMLGRGQAAFAPLLTSRDRGRRSLFLGMALIAGPAAALAADAIPRWLGAQGVSTVTAMATGAASLLASLTAWLRHQLAWVGDRLKQIEEVQRKFDQSVERAQSDNRKAIREAEERLRLLEADYIAAQRKEEEATRRTLEAEAKLTEATVSRLLTTFIEERANSNDYRKHLGMLALVRNDFEKLSDLIAEENDALDGISNDGTDPFPTIEHEARDEEKRINRIVLYIDDLDRCPPAKVVEVLQAVHLLLAFPLFVVVVGVDARWVLRSIEARYRELLKSDGNAPDQGRVNEFKELFGYASAHDYVEKIFQVPFWLKPMSPESSRRLVRDLLKASVVDDAATSDTATGESRPAVKGSMMTPPAAGTANGASVGQSSSQSPDPLRSDAAMTNMEGGIGEETRTPPDLTAAGLEITRAEFDSISDLAPLLGRSPRTLKRFVNVYRLIRVGLSPWERELFLSDAHGLPDYRSVLLLLAIDTGAPKVATPFFNTIRELMSSIPLQPPREKKGRATAPRGGLSALLDRLNEDAEINTLEEWHRVGGWLHARLQNQTLPDDVSRVARWIPRVSRFSFHTGRLG